MAESHFFQGDFAMFQRMHDPAYLDREKWNLCILILRACLLQEPAACYQLGDGAKDMHPPHSLSRRCLAWTKPKGLDFVDDRNRCD